MSEKEVVERTERPATIDSIAADLSALGVKPGATVLVHSSLSALGWVSGGAVAIVHALRAALGESGTLVMPAHSNGLSDPARWVNPPVPETWWNLIRATMPPYDPRFTPTILGAVAEVFRSYPGVLRSAHPHYSFTALGPQAERILAGHELEYGLGEDSPLARIYEAGGSVLLLGTGHDVNTSMHLAEYRAQWPDKKIFRTGAPMVVGGERRWIEFDDLDLDSSDFTRIGGDLEASSTVVGRGPVAGGEAALMGQPAVVDHAVRWIEENRVPAASRT
jgi:aminoglycoside 3-N-acetyltransferase